MGLGDQLRAAIQWQAGPSAKGFIPLDQIDAIVSRDSIERELLNTPGLFCLFAEQGDALIDSIFGSDAQANRSTRKVKLFAILALLNCVEKIADFIDYDCNDAILPIHIDGSSPSGKPSVLSHDKKSSLPCFGLWDDTIISAFEEQQWAVLAPVFGKNVPFVSLPSKAILPFIQDEAYKPRHGGTSSIFRVKIHPSHVEDGSKQPVPLFAVKRVRSVEKDSFRRELKALRRINSPGAPQHPNVLEFLSAWHQDGHFNIMFPWAVSDLAQWWRNNPFPTLGPGASTTLWLSHQALGIASGLRAVHQSLGSPSTSQSGDVGRHGDIKPGNILWFPSSDDPVMGTWKIADFGLSAVESSPSFLGSNRLGCTPAYRAPEYDMPEREVGMSYDIWSLGCVLLECLTWSLVGLDGIKELEIRRSETAENGKKDNAFWEMVEAPRMDLALPLSNQAALKAVVSKWMDSLKASGREQSSAVFAYIEDLSSLIGKKMLVPEETQRSSSSEIVTELQKMHDKFLEQANVAAPQAASMPESETVEDQLAALINSPMQDVPALSLGEYTGEASIPADILDELALAAPCPDMISSWNGDKLHHTEPGAMNLDVPMSTDWPTINYTEPSTFQSGAFVHNHTEPIQQTVPSCGGLSSNTTRGSKRWLDIDEAPKESRTKQRRLEPETQPCKALKASSANKKSKVAQACGGPSNHSSPDSTALRFSCPFHKYDPQTFGIHDPRWRTCVGPGWTTMHRVKEHIDRKHTVQPNTCSRCLTAFPGPLELSQHQKADTPCKVNHENKFLVTDAQRALMRKRPRGRSEVGAWNDMYRIIFGLSESDAVPWPYHETAASPEESLPTVASQPSTTSLEDFDNYLTQSVMPGADAETMAKIQGYLDLAKQFRQVNSGSASQTANETVLSSVPSLMSDGFSYMTHSQLSEDSLMEMPAMDFSSSLGQDLGNAMKTSGPALNLLDAWSPSCLTKEEEELSRMLFCDPGSQHAEDDWLQSIS